MRALASRDLRVAARSRMVLLPMLLVPLLLLVGIPVLLAVLLRLGGEDMSAATDLAAWLQAAPASATASLEGLPESEALLLVLLVYMLAPLYLILPTMTASVLAADSIVGERERKTLEGLLHSPLTSEQIVTAKLAAGWLAAMAVSLVGLAGYALVVNVLAWPAMGRIFFPTPLWWVLALWVAPAVAAASLGAMVLVSARVRTFQEAYQASALVVLPIVLLVIGQASGAIYFGPAAALLLGAAVWLVAGLLIAFGLRRFRERGLFEL